MPFCHRFSPNYGSLVTLCCLARSVYMYRNSANSMSPFSTHRHPCILAYLTMPCGFATCVLYAELSTYACLRREKKCYWDAFQLLWQLYGLFQARPENISPWFTLPFLWVFMRPEIREHLMISKEPWNTSCMLWRASRRPRGSWQSHWGCSWAGWYFHSARDQGCPGVRTAPLCLLCCVKISWGPSGPSLDELKLIQHW